MRETREWLALCQPAPSWRLGGKQVHKRWSAIGRKDTTLVCVAHCQLYGADSVHEVLICLTGVEAYWTPVGLSTRLGVSTETCV